MRILTTIAKQKKIRLSERGQAGLAGARSRGNRRGWPKKIADASEIAHLRSEGHSWREITEETGISKGTVAANCF
jgi:DNA invertase Pin-like site-specific DNA recombinase